MQDTITNLSHEDRSWLQQAEAHIFRLAHTKYGIPAFENTENDLLGLQPLIDEGTVSKNDTLEAQCIGVVLGNVLTQSTSMQWKRVTNEFGDMIALHSEQIGFTLYPLTMISRRFEGGGAIDLRALYYDFVSSLNIKR